MIRRDRFLLVGLAVAAALVAFWMTILQPKREEATRLADEAAQAEQQLAAVTAEAAAGERARAGYTQDYATLAALGKVVPGDDDIASLVFQLEATADRTGVDFRDITLADASATGAATAAPSSGGSATGTTTGPASTTATAGTATSGAGGLTLVPVKLTFDGRFDAMRTFLRTVRDFVRPTAAGPRVRGRLVTVDGVTLTESRRAFPKVKAEISATVYVAPVPQAAPAASAPTSPAGAAPASTVAPPTTSASVTPPAP